MLRFLPTLALVLTAMSTAPAAADQADPRDVRVMSYNIRFGSANDGENAWEKRRDFLIATIRAFDPDLLGTQETLANQRDALAAQLDGHEVLAAGRDDGREQGEMMALFYRKARFEKLDGGHFWLSELPDQPGSKSWDSSLPRMVSWVKLRDRTDPDTPPIAFFNTHFDHRGPQARLESARLLRRKIDDLGQGCRVVLTGDFNSPEGGEPYRTLFGPRDGESRVIIDTFRAAHPTGDGNEGTYSGFKAGPVRGGRIDWIGASTDWEVQSATIDRTSRDGRTPSDHFAVTALLRPIRQVGSGRFTLRVLSYNIHHGEGTDRRIDLPRLAHVIRSTRPDLVAVQEVDRDTRRSGQVDQSAELGRLTGLRSAFGKAIDYDGGQYGQTILSAFPIKETIVHMLPGPPDRERRIVVEARIELGGTEISFASTHLDAQLAAIRREQAERINELFRALGRPVLLAGDLNATPESPPLEILSRDWTRASSDPSLRTIPSARPTAQIDYILFRPAGRFRVLEQTVLDEAVASDHRAVLVVLDFLVD